MSSSTGQRAPRTRAAKASQGTGGTTTWTPQDQSVDPSYRPTTTAGPTTACSGGGSSCVLSKLIQLPAPPLSRHQLKKLEEHRYSSAGRSLLEPFMQHYWEWLVACVPAWIAPNLITIVGLAINILTTLVLVYYCPTATEQAPLWVYLSCAVGLFIYQSLDAIDGKQARRTNSSTPLGELFDHGCDSLSTVFVVLGTCIAVQLGTNPDWMFFCCFAGMFMFYCAHWQTYVSGTLRFGIIDVTEVQFFIIIMYLLAAIGGPAFWQFLIPVVNIQIKLIPAILTVAGAIFSCTNYFRVIFTGGVGKNGSTIAGTSVLSPFFHIGSVIILAVMIYKKSASQLFEKHPCLYVLAFGFVSAKITNKLVVAHMTKSEMYLHDLAYLGPGLLFLDQYFNSFIDEYLVLWVALFLSIFDLVRYCVSVCNQIASHLHIFVFKIKPPTYGPPLPLGQAKTSGVTGLVTLLTGGDTVRLELVELTPTASPLSPQGSHWMRRIGGSLSTNV